jgi:hypothetical protein
LFLWTVSSSTIRLSVLLVSLLLPSMICLLTLIRSRNVLSRLFPYQLVRADEKSSMLSPTESSLTMNSTTRSSLTLLPSVVMMPQKMERRLPRNLPLCPWKSMNPHSLLLPPLLLHRLRSLKRCLKKRALLLLLNLTWTMLLLLTTNVLCLPLGLQAGTWPGTRTMTFRPRIHELRRSFVLRGRLVGVPCVQFHPLLALLCQLPHRRLRLLRLRRRSVRTRLHLCRGVLLPIRLLGLVGLAHQRYICQLVQVQRHTHSAHGHVLPPLHLVLQRLRPLHGLGRVSSRRQQSNCDSHQQQLDQQDQRPNIRCLAQAEHHHRCSTRPATRRHCG